ATSEAWSEGCRGRIRESVAVGLGKELAEPAIDCGVFLLQKDVFECHRLAASRGDSSLAGAVSELAARHGLVALPISEQTWWHDVDTPEDLLAARSKLRRSLPRDGDGPVSRYLNRPISTRLSLVIASMRPSPDLLSILALLAGLAGAWLVGTGQGIAGGVVLQRFA